MHRPKEQTTFLLLRANGWSLGKISEKLNIPKSTLFHWDQQHRGEIHTVKCWQIEKLQEEYTPSFEEELQHLAAYLARVEQALQQQRFDQMRPEFLLKTALTLRARLNKFRTDVHVTTDEQAGLAPVPVGGCLSRAEQPITAPDYKPVDHAAWLHAPPATTPSPAAISLSPTGGNGQPARQSLDDGGGEGAVGHSNDSPPFENRPSILPLPTGEGRGEGQECLQSSSRLQLAQPDNQSDELCLTAASDRPLNRQFSNGSPEPKFENQNGTFSHENKICSVPEASPPAPCNISFGTTVPNSISSATNA